MSEIKILVERDLFDFLGIEEIPNTIEMKINNKDAISTIARALAFPKIEEKDVERFKEFVATWKGMKYNVDIYAEAWIVSIELCAVAPTGASECIRIVPAKAISELLPMEYKKYMQLLERLRAKIAIVENEELRKELGELRKKLRELEYERRRLEEELIKTRDEKEELKRKLRELEGEKERIEEELRKAYDEKEEMERKLRQIRGIVRGLLRVLRS